ncbi:hypothetical protein [Pseudomonas sp.]|uniref:hypothetical protein n=1 Tax=Pseudomonas sp. TaxID=306 RepID=UPI00272CBF0F|nr:hypothetical protein [Pseudomonas sp.]
MNRVWYLPLTEDRCKKIVALKELDVSALEVWELAALIYLERLAKTHMVYFSSIARQREFASLLVLDRRRLEALLKNDFDFSTLTLNISIASSLGISLMSPEDFAGEKYLNFDRTWNYNFADHAKFMHQIDNRDDMRLTDGQLRLMECIKSNQEEMIFGPAFAGAGKTRMISLIIEETAVKGFRPVTFLADSVNKFFPIKKSLGDKVCESHKSRVHFLTYTQLATNLLVNSYPNLKPVFSAAKTAPYRTVEVYSSAGLRYHPGYSVEEFAKLCWDAVSKFCDSLSSSISIAHFPSNFKISLSRQDAAAYVKAASNLWESIVGLQNPRLRMEGSHVVKLLSLNGVKLPERYGTVLIDEVHDAPRPILSVLRRSSLPAVAMGDNYQNLSGKGLPRIEGVLQAEMNFSLRSGQEVERHINPILALHPKRPAGNFTADPDKVTHFLEYPAGSLPPEPSVIAVADDWGMLDWLIRARRAGVSVETFQSGASISEFIFDCEKLFAGAHCPTHIALAHHASWDSLSREMSWNDSFSRVETWLGAGGRFGLASVPVTATSIGYLRPLRPVIAKIHDIKSFELPVIALSEDLYYIERDKSKEHLGAVINKLYTSMTRGVRSIYLPSSHRDWEAYLAEH